MDTLKNPQVQDTSHSFTHHLEDQERNFIRQLAQELPTIDVGHLDDDALLTEIALASKKVPERLARTLIAFRKNSNDYGTLLFRNLPIDETLPPTPSDGRVCRNKTTSISEATLAMLMMWLGEPIAYQDEKEGALIQNVCPVQGQEHRQENTGSVYLEFHTEDGFHPFKPDFIGLLCLKPDHQHIARTGTASIRKILQNLDEQTISLLRKPLYHIRLASSFTKDLTSATYSDLLPILSSDYQEPELCMDGHAMEAITPEAEQAMEALEGALKGALIEVALKPGDLIIIDNRVVAHTRTAFQPQYDGNDRWLQRMFVVQDFRRSRMGRPAGSHVCFPLVVQPN